MRAAVVAAALAMLSAPAFADTPIPSAGDWVLVNDPAGCWAENNHAVHLKALVNRSGHLVLAAAGSGWRADGDHVDMRLQVGNDTQAIRATMLINIVMVGIDDTAFQSRILNASSLTWHLPWGDSATPSAGLDKAFAAIAECERNKAH